MYINAISDGNHFRRPNNCTFETQNKRDILLHLPECEIPVLVRAAMNFAEHIAKRLPHTEQQDIVIERLCDIADILEAVPHYSADRYRLVAIWMPARDASLIIHALRWGALLWEAANGEETDGLRAREKAAARRTLAQFIANQWGGGR